MAALGSPVGDPLGPHRLHAGIGQCHLQITVSVSTAPLPCLSGSWSWAELWKMVRERNLAQDPTTVFAYSLGLVSSSFVWVFLSADGPCHFPQSRGLSRSGAVASQARVPGEMVSSPSVCGLWGGPSPLL